MKKFLLVAGLSLCLSGVSFAHDFELRKITIEDFNGAHATRQDCVIVDGTLSESLDVYGVVAKSTKVLSYSSDALKGLTTYIESADENDPAYGSHFTNYWLITSDGSKLLRTVPRGGTAVDSPSANAHKLVRIMNRLCK